jgi:hypothetical protein
MIRGLQKQIIQLTTPKSQYFEVVFFVLRPMLVPSKESEADMVREAQRILAEGTPRAKGGRSIEKRSIPKKQKLSLFFFGLFCGCLLSGVLLALWALLG